MTRLPADQRADAWQNAIAASPTGIPATKIVETEVKKLRSFAFYFEAMIANLESCDPSNPLSPAPAKGACLPSPRIPRTDGLRISRRFTIHARSSTGRAIVSFLTG